MLMYLCSWAKAGERPWPWALCHGNDVVCFIFILLNFTIVKHNDIYLFTVERVILNLYKNTVKRIINLNPIPWNQFRASLLTHAQSPFICTPSIPPFLLWLLLLLSHFSRVWFCVYSRLWLFLKWWSGDMTCSKGEWRERGLGQEVQVRGYWK